MDEVPTNYGDYGDYGADHDEYSSADENKYGIDKKFWSTRIILMAVLIVVSIIIIVVLSIGLVDCNASNASNASKANKSKLIEVAKTHAESLRQAVMEINGGFMDFWVHGYTVRDQALSEAGISLPMGDLLAQVSGAHEGFTYFIQTYMMVPDCDFSVSNACGYFQEVMKLSDDSSIQEINAAGELSSTLLSSMKTATANLLPVADTMDQILIDVQSLYDSNGKTYSPGQQGSIDILAGGAGTIRNIYGGQMEGNAAFAQDSGLALRNLT